MELGSGAVAAGSAAAPSWPSMTQEAASMLGEGIRLCFLRWTALQLAVENEWGGRSSSHKASQLQSDILTWFVHSKVPRYIDELEQLLDDSMIELFNVQAEDDSVMEVAEQLMVLHEECAQGNYENVHRLAAAASQSKPAVARSQKEPNANAEEDSDSDDEDDLMDDEDHNVSTSSGQQDMRMDSEPLPAQSGAVQKREGRVPTLTEEEMADGWQAAPTRSRRRSGQRT